MAGDPDPEGFLAYAEEVLRVADVLEVGVPFRDPVADGPVIEAAHARALAGGMNLPRVLDLAARLRTRTPKPLVLMTYVNPVLRFGLDAFARKAREAGVDGVILPDVPLEEADGPGRALAGEGIDHVLLASPASGPERFRRMAKATRGFLYVVSSYGVTGARDALPPEAAATVREAAEACQGVTPFAVGFGVSRPAHVRELGDAGAPGVVVGSALVARIGQGEPPGSVGRFLASLRD